MMVGATPTNTPSQKPMGNPKTWTGWGVLLEAEKSLLNPQIKETKAALKAKKVHSY